MVTITRQIEETIYISDEELEKRAEQWGMTVDEIVDGLENGDFDYDDFEHCSDYTVESQKISTD